MLETIAFILEKGIRISLTFAGGLILLQALDQQRFKKYLWWGLAVSFIAGSSLAYTLKSFKLREEFDAIWALSALILCIGVFVLIWRSNTAKIKKENGVLSFPFKLLIFNIAFLISIQDFIELAFFPRSIFNAESPLNTELFLKIGAVILGIGISILLGNIFAHISRFLDKKKSLLVATIVFISIMVLAMMALASSLLVLGFLPANAKTVAVVAPLINYQKFTLYALLFALAAVLFMGRANDKNEGRDSLPGLNPAQARKIKAAGISKKYWIRSGYLFLAITIAFMALNYALGSRKITLSPADKIASKDGSALIPIEMVSDGNLHRFSYVSEDGVNIRFIIVEKREGIFGIGYDACEICGPVGYYQRKKGVIVCLACDVVMNLDMIGLPGGCNPIPLAYTKEKDFLSIKVPDIEKRKKVFRK